MVEGRDSAYPPSAAQLAAFHADGVRVYGGYIKLGNDGVLSGWTQADFARVRAAGMTPIAFFSGFDNPATIKALAALWGVRACLDDESGMRPDGSWVQGELDASGAGLYGNAPYQNRTAAFHVLAAYPTSGDPGGESWPSWLARPAGPCGWQWAGSHVENGITVDSAWYDDSFSPAFSGASGSLTGDSLDLSNPIDLGVVNTLNSILADVKDVYFALGLPSSNPADASQAKSAVLSDILAAAQKSSGGTTDVSGILAAANDAKAAAVAAQAAAENAAQALMAASSVITAAAADIKAIRAKTDKDLS